LLHRDKLFQASERLDHPTGEMKVIEG